MSMRWRLAELNIGDRRNVNTVKDQLKAGYFDYVITHTNEAHLNLITWDDIITSTPKNKIIAVEERAFIMLIIGFLHIFHGLRVIFFNFVNKFIS